MTAITKFERVVLSGVLGGSNMGMPSPTRDNVQAELKHLNSMTYRHSPKSMVQSTACNFWGRYMDDNGAERVFVDECWSWHQHHLKNETRESITRIWPHVAALVW